MPPVMDSCRHKPSRYCYNLAHTELPKKSFSRTQSALFCTPCSDAPYYVSSALNSTDRRASPVEVTAKLAPGPGAQQLIIYERLIKVFGYYSQDRIITSFYPCCVTPEDSLVCTETCTVNAQTPFLLSGRSLTCDVSDSSCPQPHIPTPSNTTCCTHHYTSRNSLLRGNTPTFEQR